MHYVAVEWMHHSPDDPVHLFYELDNKQYECRKVEVFRNGVYQFADASHEQGSTFLSWEVHPLAEQIASDPQFKVLEITRDDFERVWSRALEQEKATM